MTCSHRFFEKVSSTDGQEVLADYGETYSGFRDDPYFRKVVRDELRERLIAFLPTTARILDVGCGNGAFMEEALALGHEALGVDNSATAVQLCKSRSLPAICGDFTRIELASDWDLVTLWDVLEHLWEPHDFIARAYEVLRPFGQLLIKTPYVSPSTFRIVRRVPSLEPVFLQAPAHVQFFTHRSLERLLEENGFRELRWLPSRRMRGRRKIRTPRQLAGLGVRVAVNAGTRNGNLYALAKKTS